MHTQRSESEFHRFTLHFLWLSVPANRLELLGAIAVCRLWLSSVVRLVRSAIEDSSPLKVGCFKSNWLIRCTAVLVLIELC